MNGNISSKETIVKENWQANMPPLSDAKYEADVVVVGSGAAGMSAAIEAANMGLDVIVLEAMSYLGGNTSLSEGVFAYDSKYVRAMGNKYDPFEMIEYEMEYHHYHCNYNIIKDFVMNSPDNITWLEDMGVTFYEKLHGLKYAVQHFYKGKGKAMINDAMKPRADKLGVRFLMKSRGQHLYLQGRKVTGISVEGPDGEYAIKTKVVVLACGGFMQNPEMVRDLLGVDGDRIFTGGSPGHLGDAVRMAYEVGGDQSGRVCAGYVFATLEGMPYGDHAAVAACNEPYFWVNEQGKRFLNEDLIRSVVHICNAMLTQKKVYSILSQTEINRLMAEPCTVGWGSYVFQGDVMDKVQTCLDKAMAKKPTNIFRAVTIGELAEKIDIKPESLQNTVDNYNSMVEKGEDAEFGKPAQYLRKVEGGPFYAFDLKCYATNSHGGVRVNTSNEVLNPNFDPIPGLYCAGLDCSGLTGDTYCINLMATTQSYSMYSGRNSARHAHAYIKG